MKRVWVSVSEENKQPCNLGSSEKRTENLQWITAAWSTDRPLWTLRSSVTWLLRLVRRLPGRLPLCAGTRISPTTAVFLVSRFCLRLSLFASLGLTSFDDARCMRLRATFVGLRLRLQEQARDSPRPRSPRNQRAVVLAFPHHLGH